MKEAQKAIVKGLIKSAVQTLPLGRDRINPDISRNRYLTVLAHPDDETLIAGIVQRISRYSENPAFVVFTNGNGNTAQERLPELIKSLRNLGYDGEVTCLMKEKDITSLACIPHLSEQLEVSDNDLARLSIRVGEQVNSIERKIIESRANTILVPDYAGGHIVHDITQMATVIAARRVSKRRLIEVLEFPQYFISSSKRDIRPKRIRELIKKAGEGDNSAGEELETQMKSTEFALGKFSPGIKENFSDSQIGMQSGTIHLTMPEFIRKLKSYLTYKNGSQDKSLARLTSNSNSIGDLSLEHLRRVPFDRDYTIPPSTGLFLYEIVSHRPFARFSTFKKLYERLAE